MRWMLRLVLAFAALAAAGALALVMMPSEQVARVLGRQIEAATGQRLVIGGEVRPTLWPELGVRIGDIRIEAPEGDAAGGEVALLEAEQLVVGVNASALWGGEVRVQRVELVRPVIQLERLADGHANWVVARETGAADGNRAEAPGLPDLTRIILERGEIRGGQISYSDERSGGSWQVNDLDLTVRLPDPSGPAELAVSATSGGQRVKASLRIASLAKALSGGVPDVTASLTSGALSASFVGRAGFAPVMAEGRIEAESGDPLALAAMLGLPPDLLADGLGRRRMALSGDVTFTAERTLHLRRGNLALDKTQVAGEFDLTPGGPRPKIVARLAVDRVALPGLLPAGQRASEDAGGAGGARAGWPKDRIDVSALGLLDGTVRLSVGELAMGETRIAPLAATVTIDNARAVADVTRAGAFGGTLAGQFVANGRGGLSVRGDLTASSVAVQEFLKAVAGYERLTGTGDLSVRFLGVGNSIEAIMGDLGGQGSLALRDGELRGVDLAAMLRTLDPARVGEETRTRYETVSATFAIAGGILGNDDLMLAAPLVTATGQGRIDLGKRRIDYRLTPVALPDADGTGGLKVPVRITGSWEAPEFALDLEAVAQERLERKRRKAEAELADQLGITPAEGESLEDAARRKLEEEAAKSLGRLLGGN